MLFWNWVKGHRFVSVAIAAAVPVFTFVLAALRAWNDAKDAKEFFDMISDNVASIIEFSQNPIFPWLATAAFILAAVAMIFWAAKRDEKARKQETLVAERNHNREVETLERLEAKTANVTKALSVMVRHIAATRLLASFNQDDARLADLAKRIHEAAPKEPSGVRAFLNARQEYQRLAHEVLGRCGVPKDEREAVVGVSSVDRAEFDSKQLIGIVVEDSARAEYTDATIMIGKVERKLRELSASLLQQVANGNRMLEQIEDGYDQP